jgi:SP family sugar porter-like MFS transporter
MQTYPNTTINWPYLILISLVAAIGGFLFGYDWVVIGGAKIFYEKLFQIADSPALQGWAMSSAIVGCLLGSVLSGMMSEQYGRKKLLFATALIFLVASIGTGLANSFDTFVFYRILGGVGIGIASTVSPMYIAEITPAKYRGRFVSLNQLALVIGILAAQLVNNLISEPIHANETQQQFLNSWNVQYGWRWMFYACAFPAGLFLLLLLCVPESPVWLMRQKNKTAVAHQIWSRIGESIEDNRLSDDVSSKLSLAQMYARLKSIPSYRRIMLLGVFLAVFQQWCGINVIFNYADEVFAQAGYGIDDTLFNIVFTGLINLVFTLVGTFTVDSLGRRKLVLLGATGLSLIYLCLGGMYFFEIKGLLLLILILLGIACYAMTLAPVTWVILSEIFPAEIRGFAMSIATFVLWAACFLLTYSFPFLNAWFNASGTFWLYGLISVGAGIFLYYRLKETKGKSFEEINNMYQ